MPPSWSAAPRNTSATTDHSVRRRGPDRHERVHRRRAVPQVHERVLVERPARPQDHGCRQCERHPLPTVELQRRHHRDEQHRDRQHDRHDEARPEITKLIGLGIHGRDVGDRVAEVGNRAHELAAVHGMRVEGDGRALRREVHRGARNARLRVEGLLDADGARRTRHALDRQVTPLDGAGRRRCRIGRGHQGLRRSWPHHRRLAHEVVRAVRPVVGGAH